MGNANQGTNEEHTPLGTLLAWAGFIAGAVIGWDVSGGNFIATLIFSMVLTGIGLWLGNLVWRVLIITASVAMAIFIAALRQGIIEGALEALTAGN